MLIMHLYIFLILIFCFASTPAWSERTTWLVQGKTITDDEAAKLNFSLDLYKRYFPVNNSMELYFRAKHDEIISNVVVAAIHQQGYVYVTEGGENTNMARIRYTSKNGKPDEVYVSIQTIKLQSISIEDNVAKSMRVHIVHEGLKNFTLDET